ncbi:hypothetical protein [Candidatus Amarolinea dominans]|uniref:hypothetical protein n=1 Tax=Candidatus Amarolinea dominans TaxID=3140696 RepID=UPI001E11AF45|nr:hypothetical protein [Anaerolineae bacterium]
MEKLDEATTRSVDGPPAQRWLALALMVGGWALYGPRWRRGCCSAIPVSAICPAHRRPDPPDRLPVVWRLGWLWTQATPWWPEPARGSTPFSVLWGGVA